MVPGGGGARGGGDEDEDEDGTGVSATFEANEEEVKVGRLGAC